MPAKILGLTPRKPAINGEAIYEGGLGGAYDVRRTAWLSFLSGAAGYTTGIDAVYAWEDDAIAQSNVPSIDQVALLGQLLRALPWWDLSPASERILNQSEDRAKLMAFALTEDRRIGVGYLPENAEVRIDLRGGASKYDTLWIEPSTGQTHRGPSVDADPEVVLSAPDGRDWALLLTAPDSPFLARVARVLADTAFQRKGSSASIHFTKDAPVDGLVRRTPGDGAFTYTSHDGVQCIVNQNPKRNSYLYIDVDDRLVFRGALKAMRVEIQLHSNSPLENIQLQYDAQGPADGESVYRSVSPSGSKQMNGWTVLEFVANAPYCGNRQNSGADFRLHFAGYQCHVALLQVTFAE
jgi:hypothetical protein